LIIFYVHQCLLAVFLVNSVFHPVLIVQDSDYMTTKLATNSHTFSFYPIHTFTITYRQKFQVSLCNWIKI